MPEFYIPGEADRGKQLTEIQKLINIKPDELPPNAQQPTVLPEPDVDDDLVHIEVCKLWLVSEVGRFLKESQPAAYLNVILHKRMHDQNLAMKTMQMSDGSMPGQSPMSKAV